jgi:alpha-2-macroglobulin
MKKKWLVLLIGAIIITLVSVAAIYKFAFKPKPLVSTKDFSNYIAAHTSGTISTRDAILITFASNISDASTIGKDADSRLVRIRPSVKGTLTWIDERTIEFIPVGPLNNDTEYRISVALDRVIENIPADYKEYHFAVRTIKQAMEVKIAGIEFYTEVVREDRRISGTIHTADFADSEKIKETLKANQKGKSLSVSWSTSSDNRTHQFWIEGVNQTDNTEIVSIAVYGKPLGVVFTQFIESEVPPKGVFRVLSHNAFQAPEQYLEIRFSEPIDPSQNLRGLVRISGDADLRIVVDGNIVKAYPTTRLAGSFNFEVSEGIRNTNRQRLEQSSTISVTFEVIKPQVRLIGQGVILPSSGGLLFPFQAVSLRAVDVSVTRVFESNIAQFLQVNNLAGQSELRRVGRLLLRKTVMLDQTSQTEFARWNTFNIDLAELIKTEPGAIYQVNISFRKEHSTYSCNGNENTQAIELIDIRYDSGDDVPRTYYYDDYENDYEYYDWRERENPCHVSYYSNKSVRRNVLASDLGMIAKSNADGTLLIAITDLNTAQPLSGINIDLVNYQQQVFATATTDNNGLANIKLTEQQKPFLAVAKSGKQRGYLKLDQGSALSLSSFDISGVAVQKGLKGFIYGERGVWRPGDTLFVSFIIEDKGKTLPPNHPVTFELNDSRGQQIYRTVSTRSVSGMYAFPVATDKDAPTGNYTARVRVGGVTFTQLFKVETIMPNRLKINLNIDGEALYYGKVSPVNFSSKWLHGAPARSLKVKVDAILTQASTTFEGYKGYSFDDPARSFAAEEQTIFEGRLDEKGEVSFSPNITVRASAPGKLNVNFTTRVFEEGGAFSIDRFTMPYYPYRNFVGVKMPDSKNKRNTYLTDTLHKVEVVLISAEGKPIPRQSLRVEVYKIDWRWWWERSNEDLSNYISSSYRRPIHRESITTDANGKAIYNLRINNPEWGRFLIRAVDIDGNHAAGTIAYFDWPGWVSRDKRSSAEAATMLVFASDKEKYNVGESVNLTIPSPAGGKIFLTVENGVKVLQSHWIDAKAGETQFSLIASGEMAPNVFINAMLIQQHSQTTNDLPIRMYGIVPISVEDPKTHVTPIISMADVIEPEQKVSITISEKDGKPMAFTLAVVDDGLLDLTRFRTPSPWQSFYAKEALGVRTWDLYDLVLGASTARMQRIISIGGDDEASSGGDKTANRFKPVVRYFGPFELERGKKERIDFVMPNYIGSVRVMAIAAKDGAYGTAEKTVPVRKPLMVLATLPRVLGPEEEVVLPISLFAMEPSIKQVKVKIETNSLLNIQGSKEQTIRFDEVGDKVVRFNLKVASSLGVARVKVIAESGKERASHEIELNVRNPNPPMTLVQDTVLRAGESWAATYKAFGIQGTNTAVVELSTLPPVNLGDRLKYLLNYPHGCLEQTVSTAFPQLYISKLADIGDVAKRNSEDNVRFALDKMRNFRTADGGLSLWPGSAYADDWASTYAGHFMLEAQRLGYTVPSGVLDSWRRSTQKVAQNWSPTRQGGYYNSDLMQAYRLYVLALAKSPEMGAMNRLRESANLSVAAKWRLAAAFVLAGNPEAARTLINGVPPAVNNYREQGYTYGSDIRDKAMIIETLLLLNDLEKAMPLLRELSKVLSSSGWMSTQETSFSLLAFSKYAELSKSTDGVDAQIAIHGKSSKRYTSKQSILQHTFDPVQTGNDKVEVKNVGQGTLYTRLITHGIPVGGMEVAQSNNLQIEINYHQMNGSRISPEKITQGTDFYADVRVYNPGTRGNLEQLILSFIVPSGWEIRTSRLDEGQQAALRSSAFDYQDIRDDRVYTYFNLNQGQAKSFRVRFNATYEGKFYMPGITCEAMYDNSINARRAGGWVEVIVP